MKFEDFLHSIYSGSDATITVFHTSLYVLFVSLLYWQPQN